MKATVPTLQILLSVLTMVHPSFSDDAAAAGAPGARIARWRGDARGAVSLYYDDGTDSSYDIVRPALIRRHLPGTFYICCGWFQGADDPKLARWAEAFSHPEIVPGDHTWTHNGVDGVAQLADEISRNGAMLRDLAKLPPDAPLSFAVPGGVRWNVTSKELADCLAEHGEALRHDFGENICGPSDMESFPIHTCEDALPALDRAERDGEWEALLFHGVGGDWLRFPADEHERLLDELAARVARRRLWVGAAMEVHLYALERGAVSLGAPKANADGTEIELGISADARIPHAVPLTVVLDVPLDWTEASVSRVADHPDGTETAPYVIRCEKGKAVFDVPYATATVRVRKAGAEP